MSNILRKLQKRKFNQEQRMQTEPLIYVFEFLKLTTSTLNQRLKSKNGETFR